MNNKCLEPFPCLSNFPLTILQAPAMSRDVIGTLLAGSISWGKQRGISRYIVSPHTNPSLGCKVTFSEEIWMECLFGFYLFVNAIQNCHIIRVTPIVGLKVTQFSLLLKNIRSLLIGCRLEEGLVLANEITRYTKCLAEPNKMATAKISVKTK